jgi:hypothetical protein
MRVPHIYRRSVPGDVGRIRAQHEPPLNRKVNLSKVKDLLLSLLFLSVIPEGNLLSGIAEQF